MPCDPMSAGHHWREGQSNRNGGIRRRVEASKWINRCDRPRKLIPTQEDPEAASNRKEQLGTCSSPVRSNRRDERVGSWTQVAQRSGPVRPSALRTVL